MLIIPFDYLIIKNIYTQNIVDLQHIYVHVGFALIYIMLKLLVLIYIIPVSIVLELRFMAVAFYDTVSQCVVTVC